MLSLLTFDLSTERAFDWKERFHLYACRRCQLVHLKQEQSVGRERDREQQPLSQHQAGESTLVAPTGGGKGSSRGEVVGGERDSHMFLCALMFDYGNESERGRSEA